MNNVTAAGPGLLTLAVNKLFESPLVLFFGGCALAIVHYLYSFYLLLAGYFNKLHSALRFIKRLRTDNVDFCDHFRKEVLRLRKIPVHLVLILGPEEPSYIDIVKFITYCLPAGISHVSVYDHKNTFDSWRLYDTFCCVAKQHLHNIKWGKSFSEEVKELSKKRINGFVWNPAVTVHCVNDSDGLQQVATNLKSLYKHGAKEIKLEELNALMEKSLGAPSPELAVICGSSFTFYGYPPWNMRVTQMLMLETHFNLTASTFLSLLQEYSSSVQRYGK